MTSATETATQDAVLNEEEADAIRETLKQDSDTENADGSEPTRFDFCSRERVLLDQMKSLSIMNDLMGEEFGKRLSQNFKLPLSVSIEQIEMLNVADCLSALKQGSVYNSLDLNLVKGKGLLEVPAQLMAFLVDHFFGNAFVGEMPNLENADVPASHLRFNRKVVVLFMESLKYSWQQVSGTLLNAEHKSSAIDPEFIDFVPESELAVRFKVEVSSNEFSTHLTWVMPFASFEPFREKSSGESGNPSKKDTRKWQKELTNSLAQVHLESRVLLGSIDLSFDQITRLKPGDILPVGDPRHIQILINEELGFLGEYGTNGESKVVNITQNLYTPTI